MYEPYYMKYNATFLKLGAMCRVERFTNVVWATMFYFWRFICCFSLLVSFVGVVIDTIHKRHGDFNSAVLNCVYLGSYFIGSSRYYYYYISESKCEKLMRNMDMIFKNESKTGFEEVSMSDSLKVSKFLTYSWFIMTALSAGPLVLLPVLFGGYAEKNLPLPGWYPYDYTISPYYEITVFVQAFNQLLMIILSPSTDMFYSSSLLLLSKQFQILGWEIKNLLYTNLIRNGIPKKIVIDFKNQFNDCIYQINEEYVEPMHGKRIKYVDIYKVLSLRKFHDDLLKSFNELVSFHQSLLSMAADMESFFSPVMLMYFIPMMCVMMSFSYSLITSTTATLIIEDAVVCTWILLEVMFLSFFAELVTSQCEKLRSDLYDFPWYLCDRRLKSNFRIVQVMMNKPVSLSVGKFTNLGLNMFVWFTKSAYSFTTVLRNITQR